MKKLLITSCLIIAGIAAQAQTTKGSKIVGGNVYLTSSSEKFTTNATSSSIEGYSNSALRITPQFGYFFSDNLAGLFSIGYNTTKFKYPAGTGYEENKSSQLVLGAELKKYFMLGQQFAITAGPEITFSTGNSTESYDSRKEDITTLGGSLNAGISFFPTKRIGIEAGLGVLRYTSSTYKAESGDKKNTNDFSLIGNNGFGIGISFYF